MDDKFLEIKRMGHDTSHDELHCWMKGDVSSFINVANMVALIYASRRLFSGAKDTLLCRAKCSMPTMKLSCGAIKKTEMFEGVTSMLLCMRQNQIRIEK